MAKVNDKHIPFLTGEVCSTTGVSIDEKLSEKYSDEVIELAIQLKANNLVGVGGERENNAKKPLKEASDTFFIQYAQRMLHQQFQSKIFETFHKRANNCPINDSQWAVYSADEILAMEKNGYVIPDEIVAWAHSQQQLDVTNYVLSIDSDSEDSTIEDTFANTDSLDVLQATAKKNIEKAEKATEKVKEKQDKYNTIAEQTAQLKREKENEFEKSVKEVKELTNEWETLKNKKDDKGLSNNEQQKFNQISNQLKNGQGNNQKLNSGESEIEDFLGELDGLNLEITNTNQIAKDTINSGRTLNTITKNYNAYNLPYAYTGTSFDNSGLISMPLNGMTNEDIGELAVQKGEELDTNNTITSEETNGGEFAETIEFATEFTQNVEETKGDVDKVKDENSVNETEQNQGEETAPDENEQTTEGTEENNGNKKNGKPAVKIGIMASLEASAKVLGSSAINVTQTKNVKSDNIDMNKELKITKRQMNVINKEVDKLNEKLTGNEQDTENFLLELERLQAENPDDSVQINAQTSSNETETEKEEPTANDNNAQPTEENAVVVKNGQSDFEKSAQAANTVLNAFDVADEIVATNKNKDNSTEVTDPEEAAEEAKKSENKSKQLEIAQNIQDLGEDRGDISTNLEKAIESGDNATKKGIKTLNKLNKSNNELTVQNDKTKDDASVAVDTGVGTYALGVMDNFNGIATFNYGVLLTANPFTFSQGLFMIGIGTALMDKGTLEITSGVLSVTSGTAGKATSAVANNTIGSAISTMTEAESVLNVDVLNINDATNEAEKSEENPQQTPENAQITEPSETGNSPISDVIAQNVPMDGTETSETTNEVAQNSPIAESINNTVTAEEHPQTQLQPQPQTQSQTRATGFAEGIENPDQTSSVEKQEETTPLTVNNEETVNEEQNLQPQAETVETNEEVETNNETEIPQNKTQETNATQEETSTENNNEETNVQNVEQTADEVQPETNETTATTETSETSETSENEVPEATEETENSVQNSTQTAIQENKVENTADENTLEVKIDENDKNETRKTKENDKKSNTSKEKDKEVTAKDANTAAKESKNLKQEVDSGKKEQQKSQKDMKKISKEIKDINKKTKKDEEKFKKEINQEQKQIEQKNKEIEQKSQQIQKKQEEQAELQVDIEALNAAFSSTTADKQTEIQTNIQTKSGALTGKNSEIAETAAQLGVLKIANTKKFHTLNRSIQQYTGLAKRNLKTANNANKTSDKILKIADTTSQIAGLASIAGNITSRIGNAVTAAGNAQIVSGNIQISTGIPLLSDPFTASAGAALVASGTSLVVAGTGQVATGTTTSLIGESVALAANITNTAANATKAAVFVEQGNITGAIMSVGSAIMSGVSAGQNVSQIGELNKMADSAAAVSTAAQQVSTEASAAATSGATAAQVSELSSSMDQVMNGVKDATGNVVSEGFNATKDAFAKSTKFTLDDMLQVGGVLQSVGSMLTSDKNGSAEDVQKDRRLRRFGTISRINSKKKLQKVNAVSSRTTNNRQSRAN